MKQEELEVLKLLEKGEISAQEAAARMSETSDSNVVVVPSREERGPAAGPRIAPVARAKPSRDGRGGSFVAATAAAAVVGLIAGAIGLGAILVAIAALIFGAILICAGVLLVPLSWVAGIFGFAKPDVRLPVVDWWRRRR
jgi:Flp pilus assembly protein TadB